MFVSIRSTPMRYGGYSFLCQSSDTIDSKKRKSLKHGVSICSCFAFSFPQFLHHTVFHKNLNEMKISCKTQLYLNEISSYTPDAFQFCLTTQTSSNIVKLPLAFRVGLNIDGLNYQNMETLKINLNPANNSVGILCSIVNEKNQSLSHLINPTLNPKYTSLKRTFSKRTFTMLYSILT